VVGPSSSPQRAYGSACPGCGAPVRFLSAASTHAVCGYCHSTLVRDGETLSRIGKMAEDFEDYSPLQLMAQGKHRGIGFTVIGRLQYRYDGGVWTEWRCALDDGSQAWLSEDNGSFVWAAETAAPPNLPEVARWQVGQALNAGGRRFTVASITQAALSAAQGELPRLPEQGRSFTLVEARSADDREPLVLSIDYGSTPPVVYRGEPVALEMLSLCGLKDAQAQGGSDRTFKARQFSCPHCGSTLEVKLATTQSMSCPSCESLIDLSQGLGGELKHAIQDEPIRPLIPLGTEGDLQGRRWQVVGYQHRTGQEPDDPNETFGWEEYLLYNTKSGFVFLVDSTDGWSLVKPLTGAPQAISGHHKVRHAGRVYTLQYQYKGQTEYVCGEFYWKVQRGQQTFNADYIGPAKHVLSSERAGAEVTWSGGETLDHRTVAKAFGQSANVDLFRRADAQPLSSLVTGLGSSTGMGADWGRWLGNWWVLLMILVLIVMLSRCSRECDPAVENCNTRTGGTTYGGGFGGHK
jgi:hypothetical protein